MGGNNQIKKLMGDSKSSSSTPSKAHAKSKPKDEKSTAVVVTPRELPLELLKKVWSCFVDFPPGVREIILDYHASCFDVSGYTFNNSINYTLFNDCINFTLFGRNAISALIWTHALHNIGEEVLALAQRYPESLRCVATARSPNNKLAEGTPLRLAAAAGNHMLVSELRKLLTKEEAAAQLRVQFSPGWEQETKDRMDEYHLAPLRRFTDKLAEAKLSSKGIKTYGQAIKECKHIIHPYRDALKSLSNNPVKTGLIFDLQVYLDAYQIILNNKKRWSGWNSLETGLMYGIGYQLLLNVGSAFIPQSIKDTVNDTFAENKDAKLAKDLIFSDCGAFFSDDSSVDESKFRALVYCVGTLSYSFCGYSLKSYIDEGQQYYRSYEAQEQKMQQDQKTQNVIAMR